MKRKFNRTLAVCALLLAVCCAPKGEKEAEEKHLLPVSIPSVCVDPTERAEYALMHMWDDFGGVAMEEVEGALSNFICILDNVPLQTARKAVEGLFDKIVLTDAADTSAHLYALMTQMVSKYLYDPNSPLRDEDYYLPFVERMASCPLTPEELRPAYEFEAEGCRICRRGSVAPDFTLRTADGRDFTLHSVKAPLTLLFFNNPGCAACKEISESLASEPLIMQKVGDGSLAVIRAYIDHDLDSWREDVSLEPSPWTSCYDPRFVIRDGRLYDVRAIPSLYLLDSEKRVLAKDAPVEKIILMIMNQQP